MNLPTQLPERVSDQPISRFVAVVLSLLAATAISACGGGGGGTASVSPDGSLAGITCATGQVYTSSGCETETAYTSGTYWGTASGLDSGALEQMLKLAGYCDQYSWINLGSESCATYDKQAVLVLQVSGTYAQAVLYTGASSPYNASNAIPITVAGTMNSINSNSGYIIQSSSGVELFIDTGSLTGSSIPAHMTYQGGTIASFSLQLSQ